MFNVEIFSGLFKALISFSTFGVRGAIGKLTRSALSHCASDGPIT